MGLYLLSSYLIDSIPPIAKLKASALTLSSLFKLGTTSSGHVVKISFSCSNAFC